MLLPYKIDLPLARANASRLCLARFRLLLDGTSDRGEYGVGTGPDELNGSDHNDENHRQHDCIFRDILSFLFAP